jgi:hypothetical protein
VNILNILSLEMDEISPGKFSGLPEEIRSRIIRRAGAGTVTRQHRELTIADRVKTAGSSPFTQEEVEWLINVRREIIVCVVYETNAYLILASMDSKRKNNIVGMRELNVEISTASVWYDTSIRPTFTVGRISPVIAIRDSLIGSRDTKVDKTDNNYFIITDEENFVLTDVRSIFLILRKRFMIVLSDGLKANQNINDESTKLSREWTKNIFNVIVDDLWQQNLYTLLPYLIFNAITLELDVNMDDYITTWDQTLIINNEWIFKTESQCKKLYIQISDYIGQM